MFSSDEVNRSRTALMSPEVTHGALGALTSVTMQTSQSLQSRGSPRWLPAQPTGAWRRSGTSIGAAASAGGVVATRVRTAATARNRAVAVMAST